MLPDSTKSRAIAAMRCFPHAVGIGAHDAAYPLGFSRRGDDFFFLS
jgi:hypothetical protein